MRSVAFEFKVRLKPYYRTIINTIPYGAYHLRRVATRVEITDCWILQTIKSFERFSIYAK